MPKIVNSWNEWDPLKLVVVGSVEGAALPAPEPAIHYDLRQYGLGLGYWGQFPEDAIAEAMEQQDGFAKAFEKRGVKVDRVVVHKSMKNGDPISTPDWTNVNQRNAANPRDLSLILGNEIIEATGTMRCRFYEYLYMRPLFERYFREDPDCQWVSAPRPRLIDADYVPNYYHNMREVWTDEEKAQRFYDKKWALTEVEPLWDAADMIRAGKDIFLNVSSVSNELGRNWLHRYITSRGLRLHEIRFDGPKNLKSYQPWHIDTSIVFPCPGMAIYSPKKPILDQSSIDFFKKNDWELVPAADPVHIWNDPCPYQICSSAGSGKTGWISLNVISIDPKTICVDKNETGYMEQLNKLGFEVEPIAYDKLYKFGGMLHCNTLDIHREGGCEDYFPVQ